MFSMLMDQLQKEFFPLLTRLQLMAVFAGQLIVNKKQICVTYSERIMLMASQKVESLAQT